MRVTAPQIGETARRARLALNQDELDRLGSQLQTLLEYAEIAAKMPEEAPFPWEIAQESCGMPPACGLTRAEVLALAPDSCQGMIRVPRVMDSKHEV